jgi:predicted permease
MPIVLSIAVPFFALIFLGMFTRAIGFLERRDARALSKFSFYVAVPPMFFVNLADKDPSAMLNWGFIWRFEIVTLFVFLTAALMARRLFALSRGESGIFGLNAAYPNYGYMGIPLGILTFGDAAAVPLAVILFFDSILLFGLTALFMSDEGASKTQSVFKALIKMAKNPLLITIAASLVFSASGLHMPLLIDRTLNMLASAATPVALFALGVTVFGQPLRAAYGELSTIAVFRLLLHPLLMAALFLGLPGVDPLWVKVAITSACLPVAANVFVIADNYGAYSGPSASATLATTILASITVPIYLYWILELGG